MNGRQQPFAHTDPDVQLVVPDGHWGVPPPEPPVPVELHSDPVQLPAPAQNSTHASPESPPPLFWSPSCTRTCRRYECPGRSCTFQRASAPYPSLASPAGGVSAPAPSVQLFFIGSASGVMVTALGLLVLSTVRTAAFQLPKMALGAVGTPPICQSPDRLVESVLMSVMNSEGHIGRNEGSSPL